MAVSERQKLYRQSMKEKGFKETTVFVQKEPPDPECKYVGVKIHRANEGICSKDPVLKAALIKFLEAMDGICNQGIFPKDLSFDIANFFEILGIFNDEETKPHEITEASLVEFCKRKSIKTNSNPAIHLN